MIKAVDSPQVNKERTRLPAQPCSSYKIVLIKKCLVRIFTEDGQSIYRASVVTLFFCEVLRIRCF